jgi:hypothetical protein
MCFTQKTGEALVEEIDDMRGGFLPDVYVINLNLPHEDGLGVGRGISREMTTIS